MPDEETPPEPIPEIRSDCVDARGVVCVDVPCDGCGYNVRGLKFNGRCPECNYAVEETLRPDELRFAPPGHLQSLVAGANALIIAWGFALVAVIALMIVIQVGLGQPALAITLLLAGAGLFLALVGLGAGLIGAILLTIPDPRHRGRRTLALRRTIRLSPVVALLGLLLLVAGGWISAIVGTVVAYAAGVGVLPTALLLLQRDVALRERDRPRASLAEALAGSHVVLVLGIGMLPLFFLTGAGLDAAPCMALLVLLSLLPYCAGQCFLAGRIYRLLEAARDQAQERTAAPPPCSPNANP